MQYEDVILIDSNEVRRYRTYKTLIRMTEIFPKSIHMYDEWKNNYRTFLEYTENIKHYRYPNIFIKQSDKSEFTISPETIVFLSRATHRAFEYFIKNRMNQNIINKMSIVLYNNLVKIEKFSIEEANTIVNNLNNNQTINYYYATDFRTSVLTF